MGQNGQHKHTYQLIERNINDDGDNEWELDRTRSGGVRLPLVNVTAGNRTPGAFTDIYSVTHLPIGGEGDPIKGSKALRGPMMSRRTPLTTCVIMMFNHCTHQDRGAKVLEHAPLDNGFCVFHKGIDMDCRIAELDHPHSGYQEYGGEQGIGSLKDRLGEMNKESASDGVTEQGSVCGTMGMGGMLWKTSQGVDTTYSKY